jgi:hypothetical protein
MKKYSTNKTKVFAGRRPVDLINEIDKFKGSNTDHLERALRLYVTIMGPRVRILAECLPNIRCK